jgi:transposase InsO family protein
LIVECVARLRITDPADTAAVLLGTWHGFGTAQAAGTLLAHGDLNDAVLARNTPQRSRIAVHVDRVHRTPHRRRNPALGWAVGSSYDNALAETINGLYKTELIKLQALWRTVDHVELATAERVDWFNHRRLYRYCGGIPPAEMEATYCAHNPAQQPAGLSHQ